MPFVLSSDRGCALNGIGGGWCVFEEVQEENVARRLDREDCQSELRTF